MTWPILLVSALVLASLALWPVLVYIAVRELKNDIPDVAFGALVKAPSPPQPRAGVKVLLPIDGSAASLAAVEEVAQCPLPPGSTVELLYAIHSRLPVIPDFPP